MASIYSSTNKGWRLRLDWSITGQSIADNKSTLSLDLWVYDGTGYSQNESNGEAYYILQGEKRWNPYNYSSTGWYKLGSKTITVSHNADGTKSIALTAEWDCGFDSSYTPRHLSLSETVTLPTIPRASTATTSGSTLGETLAITIKRASSSFTHKLYYTCGSVKDQLIAENVGTSYSWNAPPVSLAQQSPNAETVALTLTVKTYNGSTYVGAWSTAVKLAVPSTVVPALSVAISDPTGVSDTYGGYVQLRSKVKVDITASGAQGSTIKSYSIKVGGIYAATSASGTTDYLPDSGELIVACAVTDSRGRTTTKTQSISVLAYRKPAITAISAARCNADGTANRAGTYGKVTFSGAITSLSAKNTAAYAVQYREVGAVDWTTVGRPAAGNYDPADISAVFAADKSKRYEVRVVATDAFESIGSTLRDLPAAYALYHLAKHLLSVGLGRLCDKANAIQVGLDAYFDRDVQIDGTLTLGDGLSAPLPVEGGGTGVATLDELRQALGIKDYIIEQGISGNWTYQKYASGYADLWWRGTVTPTSYTAVGSMVYTNIIRLSMPFGVTGNVVVTGSVQNLHMICNTDWSYSGKTVSFRMLRAASMTLGNQTVSLRVVGKWQV
jgi:hypothetical protein